MIRKARLAIRKVNVEEDGPGYYLNREIGVSPHFLHKHTSKARSYSPRHDESVQRPTRPIRSLSGSVNC